MATIEEYLKPPVPNSFSENNSSDGDAGQRLLPSDIANLLQGGVASAKAGDKELARSLFFKVISLDQNNESAWLWLASISEQANERFEYLQKVLSINPSNERALSWLKVSKEHIAKTFVQKGADAAKEGDKATSVQYLLQAIDYDSENEIAWMWLASLAGSLEDKLAYLQRILNINPDNEQVREMFTTTSRKLARSIAQKGVDAYHAGDKELAAKSLLDVSDYDITDIEEVWLLKAHLAESLEEKEELFSRVVEINPNNQVAVTSLKATQEQIEEKNTWRCPVCQTKEKKPFEICRVCNSVLTLDDIDFALANDSVNEVLVREGIHNLKRSFKDEITSNDYYKLGLAYLNLKDLKESIAFFQASLRLEPENESLSARIEYLTQALDLQKASQEQMQVPVVTEEALVEEDLMTQTTDFIENDSSSSQETDENLAESSLILSEESDEQLSEDVSESTNEVVEPVGKNQENIMSAVSDETSLFDSSQEQFQDEKTTENDSVLFDSETREEEIEKEESLGWPLPEVTEPESFFAEETTNESDVLFVDEELQKADTSPLELSESLKEQLEQSFGEVESDAIEETLPNNDEKAFSLVPEEHDELQGFEVADSMSEVNDVIFPSSVKEILESLPVEKESVEDVKATDSSSNTEQEMVSFVEDVAASSINLESNNDEEDTNVEESFIEQSLNSEPFYEESVATETLSAESSTENLFDEEATEQESLVEDLATESSTDEQVEAITPSSDSEDESSFFPLTGTVSFSTVEDALESLTFEETTVIEEPQTLSEVSLEVSENQLADSLSEETVENQTSVETVVSQIRESENSEEVKEGEMLHETSEAAEFLEAEVSVEESPSVEVSNAPVPVAQTFALPTYEIRVTQSAAVNTSVVEAAHIGVVSQSSQVFPETIITPDADPKNDNKTIMIVDDSPTVRKLVSMKLGKSGHRVIAAVDGIDALAKITEEIPDLILLDVTMPRLDGYQLCKLIKSNETTKHVPIVMLSGKEGLVDKVRGKMAGAATFLTKPFEPETLLKTVNEYCGIQNAN